MTIKHLVTVICVNCSAIENCHLRSTAWQSMNYIVCTSMVFTMIMSYFSNKMQVIEYTFHWNYTLHITKLSILTILQWRLTLSVKKATGVFFPLLNHEIHVRNYVGFTMRCTFNQISNLNPPYDLKKNQKTWH